LGRIYHLEKVVSLIPVWCLSSELQREKTWSRIHLVPLIMAEGDRDVYRRSEAATAREKEIMKDVEWVHFIPPTPTKKSCSILIYSISLFAPAEDGKLANRSTTTSDTHRLPSSSCRQASMRQER
jgi:hypothetical protein